MIIKVGIIKFSVPKIKIDKIETEMDFLDFSVRAMNSLKRADFFTVGEVVDSIVNEEISKIRNLGKKTENEIRTRILAFGYDRLTETEKK